MGKKEISNKKLLKEISVVKQIVKENNYYAKKIPELRSEIVSDVDTSNALHRTLSTDSLIKQTYQVFKKKDRIKNILWVLIVIFILLVRLQILDISSIIGLPAKAFDVTLIHDIFEGISSLF